MRLAAGVPVGARTVIVVIAWRCVGVVLAAAQRAAAAAVVAIIGIGVAVNHANNDRAPPTVNATLRFVAEGGLVVELSGEGRALVHEAKGHWLARIEMRTQE